MASSRTVLQEPPEQESKLLRLLRSFRFGELLVQKQHGEIVLLRKTENLKLEDLP